MKPVNLHRGLALLFVAMAAPLFGGCVAGGDTAAPDDGSLGTAEQATSCTWGWGCGDPVADSLVGATIAIVPFSDPFDYFIADQSSYSFGAYPGDAANFRVVSGFAGSGCFGLESRAYPGSYLAVKAGAFGVFPFADVEPETGTFCGTAIGGAYAFSLLGYPSRYVTYAKGELHLGEVGINPYLHTEALFLTPHY